MNEKSLHQTEKFFFDLITASQGVRQGLERHPGVALEDWFLGDDKLPAERRLEIYANMYFWRLADAIREDYPTLLSTIGKENWDRLVSDYLEAYPSRTPFIQYAGQHLPIFLERHPLLNRWPFLSDLALLEWERAAMLEAADSSYLSVEDLKKVPQEAWPAMRLKTIPALKIIDVAWDVDTLWRGVEAKKDLPTPRQKKMTLKIWRKDFIVCHERIDRGEKEAIESIQAGHTFAEMCERFESAEEATALLLNWLNSGLIASN